MIVLVFHIEINVDEIEILGDHDPVKAVGDVLTTRSDRVSDPGAVGGDIHHMDLLQVGNLEIQPCGVCAHYLAEHGDDCVFLLADVVIRTKNGR